MKIETCLNPLCGRLFECREIGGDMPLSHRTEKYACPFCNHTHLKETSGVIVVTRLSAETERVVKAMMGI